MGRSFQCYCCGGWFPHLSDVDDPQAGPEWVSLYRCEGAKAGDEFRMIVLCVGCFNRWEFDVWTDESEWMSTTPAVPFDRLPEEVELGDEDGWDAPWLYPSADELNALRAAAEAR